MLKIRKEEEANYKALWLNGKTIRLALDSSKPITELKYPEFFDIKITNKCSGKCEYCYMNSSHCDDHYPDIVNKTSQFFNSIPIDKLPFQVAIGGGEPTGHPEFIELLNTLKTKFDICPNYTTNGMFVENSADDIVELMEATKKYCGGVALSCHPHLDEYWSAAACYFKKYDIRLNFHLIISDKESIDYFSDIYEIWNKQIDYFVLLPYGVQGRASEKSIDWEYLLTKLPEDQSKIAFGANFYPYLLSGNHNIKVSLYEPEIFSKFLDLKDMKVYPSSFHMNISYEEFINQYNDILNTKPEHIRAGQALMNHLNKIWPAEYNRISYQSYLVYNRADLDCFYVDEYIDNLLDHLKSVWNKIPN